MKKSTIGILVALGVVLLMVVYCITSYNSIVKSSENVDNAYADVSVQLKRRADLIPNLVNSVKGYMSHETEVIDSITTARNNLLNAKTVSESAKANDELTTALNNLNVIVENYPDLKADTTFINLQDELAGTENRIAVARKTYNETVKNYNQMIITFPKNVIAGMFNFEKKAYFEVDEVDTEVPNVSFGD